MFVGDIGPDVSVEDLREAFQDEEMSVQDTRIVMDQASGRTKGYGFVTFRDTESARKALSKHGEMLKGRKMRVNWATTTKDSKVLVQPQYTPPEVYGQGLIRTDHGYSLYHMAHADGLDPSWYVRLPLETQAGIIRVSQEVNGQAKVVWVGNLDKNTTRMSIYVESDGVEHDLMPSFCAYGIVDEITMVSPQGFAFVTYNTLLKNNLIIECILTLQQQL